MDDVREARHNLRGRLNALKLCVSAFDVIDNPQDALEFLDMIVTAADQAVVAMDAVDEVMDRNSNAVP